MADWGHWGWWLNGMGFLFGVIKKFLKWIVWWMHNSMKILKAFELYTLKEWIVWYVHYISIKLFTNVKLVSESVGCGKSRVSRSVCYSRLGVWLIDFPRVVTTEQGAVDRFQIYFCTYINFSECKLLKAWDLYPFTKQTHPLQLYWGVTDKIVIYLKYTMWLDRHIHCEGFPPSSSHIHPLTVTFSGVCENTYLLSEHM